MHLDPLMAAGLLWPLSDPFKLFEFDFSAPPPGSRRSTAKVKVNSSGTVNAVAIWWDLQMDPQGDISLSTEPLWVQNGVSRTDGSPVGPAEESEESRGAKHGPGHWQDHWKQCWCPVFPAIERGESVRYDRL